ELELDRRVALAQTGDQPWNEIRRHGRNDADLDEAVEDVAAAPRAAFQLFHLFKNAPDALENLFALARQEDAGPVPFHQPHAEPLLHFEDLDRQRRLADMHGFGCASEVPFLGQCLEIAHLTERDGHNYILSTS